MSNLRWRMLDQSSARPDNGTQELPAEARQSFLDDMNKVAGPMAASTQTALAYVSAAGQQWIAAHPDCACSRKPGEAVACLNGSAQQARKTVAIPLCFYGRNAGTVVACCPNSFASVADSFRHVIDLALRRL